MASTLLDNLRRNTFYFLKKKVIFEFFIVHN